MGERECESRTCDLHRVLCCRNLQIWKTEKTEVLAFAPERKEKVFDQTLLVLKDKKIKISTDRIKWTTAIDRVLLQIVSIKTSTINSGKCSRVTNSRTVDRHCAEATSSGVIFDLCNNALISI